MSLADRIVVMKDGRIQQVGTPAEVYGQPASRFVASFIGTPTINLIDGRVERAGSGMRFVWAGGTIDLPAGGESALRGAALGLRPDRLEPVAARDGRPAFEGTIAAIERYGDRADVAVDCAGVRIVSRCATARTDGLHEGGRATLAVSAEGSHLFDAAGAAVR